MTHHRFFGRLVPVELAAAIVLTAAACFSFVGHSHAAEVPGPLVEVDWLKANLDQPDLVILDTRGQADGSDPYAEGHIPGAVNAPYPGGWRATRDGVPGQLPELSALEKHIGSLGISGDETVVIVPSASSSSEFGGATRIYWTLKLAGLDHLAILNGGYRAWNADPSTTLETDQPDVVAADFKANLRPELLVSSDDVRSHLDDGSTVLLDGRPPEQFKGKEKHPAAKRFGHLPGAINLDQSVFFDPATGKLVPQTVAASLLPEAAAQSKAEVVSYCNTGHWASMNWFVLSEVLGHKNVTLYDDSMVGWTENPDNPVESERSRLDDIKAWWNGNG
ncbi:thiosulfate/3-mercaptopyruvate sulfurtransferase [Rhodopseudomonas julia]|uniref:Thiosulfate/3-mercaptopyruvate sulfurtransferase n=1 Tax=Rhodopseudomonas julia TaxID=200617 RepID=A0ABU0C8C6_9BRAD|nr:sulfurtransferase [Rhodopseudomonas julia]MDQ0326774.1 thiosulfate/3-mercaptopyruvate sulfurtransferase [Rhodopseudomonas julia]